MLDNNTAVAVAIALMILCIWLSVINEPSHMMMVVVGFLTSAASGLVVSAVRHSK